ncbi:beta-caryophyllene synthase-like protein [Tanacetum coccineum]
MDMYTQMEDSIRNEGKEDLFNFAKQLAKSFIGGYMMEAKWVNKGYKLTIEEHASIAFSSGGGDVLVAASYFLGMGDVVTDETIKWALTNPPLFASIIGRLLNDIAGHKPAHLMLGAIAALQEIVSSPGSFLDKTVWKEKSWVSSGLCLMKTKDRKDLGSTSSSWVHLGDHYHPVVSNLGQLRHLF